MGRCRMWAAVGCVALIVGCGADGPTALPPTVASGISGLGEVPAPTGVATSFEVAPFDDLVAGRGPDLVAAPDGTLEIEGCRWRGPALMTFDLTWASDATIAYPVRFSIFLERARGDLGEGTAGVVTLSGPGAFSVSEDDDVNRRASRERADNREAPTWRASRQDFATETGVQCSAQISSGELLDRRTKATNVEVDPIDVIASAPDGTLEALADGVDLRSASDRLLPLPFLLRMEDRPLVDRLYVSTVGYLNAVTIEQQSSCSTVTSSVSMTEPSGSPDEHAVEVVQQRGCPDENNLADGSVEERIQDAAWDVRVTGAQLDVAAMLPTVRAVPFASVEAFAPSRFDADAYIDGQLKQLPDAVEIARFAWAGGKVAIVRRGDSELGEAYADPILALPVPFHGGGTGQSCRTHSIAVRADASMGFAIIVLQRSDLHVALSGDDSGRAPEPIQTAPAAGGRLAALVDLTGRQPLPDIANFVVTEADGTPVGCDQSH